MDDDFFRRTRPALASNYSTNLYTNRPLDLGSANEKIIQLTYSDENGETPSRHQRNFIATISSAVHVPIEQLLDHLKTPDATPRYDEKTPIITALNAIITQNPSTRPDIFFGTQQTKFYPKRASDNCTEIGSGLIAIKGLYTSIRPSIQRLVSSFKAFFPQINP